MWYVVEKSKLRIRTIGHSLKAYYKDGYFKLKIKCFF